MQSALDPALKRGAYERGARRVDSARLGAAVETAVLDVQHNVRAAVGMPLAASAAHAVRTEAAARALKAQVEGGIAGVAKQQAALEALYGAIAETGSVVDFVERSDATLRGIRGVFDEIEGALTAESDVQ